MNLEKLPRNISEISVHLPDGLAGKLRHGANYNFNYESGAKSISLIMPYDLSVRGRGDLYPVFQMNIPEGYIRRYLSERLARYTKVDDMMFLALQGEKGIGQLSYFSGIQLDSQKRDSLEEILAWDKGNLFSELLERYWLNGTASGVQPKVLVSSEKASLIQPDLIVKSGESDYPDIASNEYLCMTAAKNAGIEVPDFWLSADRELFVMKRFDIQNGQRLGMEDMAVLTAMDKYQGNYESMGDSLGDLLCGVADRQRYFDMLALSCMVGNGDAHRKNFALLYHDAELSPWLSPAYDIVCTRYYEDIDDRLALKMNGSKEFPNKAGLLKFAKNLGIKAQNHRLDEIAAAVEKTLLDANGEEYPTGLTNIIKQSLEHAMSSQNSAYLGRTHLEKVKKPRKTDALLKAINDGVNQSAPHQAIDSSGQEPK